MSVQSGPKRRRGANFILLLMLVCLASCGTFEIGFEAADESGVARKVPILALNSGSAAVDLATEETAVPPIVSQAEAQPETAGNLETAVLRVAYTRDNDVWLWTQDSGPLALTGEGGVTDVYISDDGGRIAFVRNNTIWVINSDGRDERLAVTRDALVATAPDAVDVNPSQIAWLPGTHTLLFNTVPQYKEPGQYFNDDLWAFDADTSTLTSLLPTGAGGKFLASPDGRHIAIITPGGIDLIAADGSNRRTVFTYTPVLTFDESQYYARPVWSPDAGTLVVAIPPADGLAAVQQPTTIWRVLTDGSRARLMGNIPAAFAFRSEPIFAPDLSRVAYLMGGVPNSLGPAVSELTSGVSEGKIYPTQAAALMSWSPDGRYFVFVPSYSGLPTRQIGALGMEPILLADADTAVFDVKWINDTQYLYLRQNGRSWEIILAQIGNDNIVVLDVVAGAPPVYDFDN